MERAARDWRLDLSHLQLDLGACSNAAVHFASTFSRTETAFLYGAGLQVSLAAMALRVELVLALMGIAAAAWQHFVAAKSHSGDQTLAYKIVNMDLHLDRLLPSVFEPRATCAGAAVNLLGISYDFWSLGVFAVLEIVAVQYMRRPMSRQSPSESGPGVHGIHRCENIEIGPLGRLESKMRPTEPIYACGGLSDRIAGGRKPTQIYTCDLIDNEV